MVLCCKQGGGACLVCRAADMLAVSQSRYIWRAMQQTCLLCRAVGIPSVSHSRHVFVTMLAALHNGHVCCITQQTCPAVRHSRHVCRVAQQTRLLCDTADVLAVSHSRHVYCITQQTCLLLQISGSTRNSNSFLWASTNSQESDFSSSTIAFTCLSI